MSTLLTGTQKRSTPAPSPDSYRSGRSLAVNRGGSLTLRARRLISNSRCLSGPHLSTEPAKGSCVFAYLYWWFPRLLPVSSHQSIYSVFKSELWLQLSTLKNIKLKFVLYCVLTCRYGLNLIISDNKWFL